MDKEIDELEGHQTWERMTRLSFPEGETVLPSTWTFKIKRYPDSRLCKFKAILGARGNKHIEGVNTVRFLMRIALQEGWYSRQVDFANAFVQATLKENVYISLPSGYRSSDKDPKSLVMKLNKSLYGLVQESKAGRPDIQFEVHQCAMFNQSPRNSHAKAVKQIIRYLKATRDTADADFAVLYGIEREQDPVCVTSRTGYFLFLGGCPISWTSKLQTEIALFTLEADYITLYPAMKELRPQRELLQEIVDKMNLAYTKALILHSSVFKDNNGALQLAQSPKVSPITRNIAVKYEFFRSNISEDKGILLTRIESNNQIADMFTKGLTIQMGW